MNVIPPHSPSAAFPTPTVVPGIRSTGVGGKALGNRSPLTLGRKPGTRTLVVAINPPAPAHALPNRGKPDGPNQRTLGRHLAKLDERR
jgi:hypothetical protein